MPSSPSSPAAASPASACRWTPQTAAAEGVVPLREQPADHAGQDVAATGRPQARRPRGVPVEFPRLGVPSRSGDDQRFRPLQEQGRPPFPGEPRRDPLAVRLDRVDRESRQGRHLAGVRGEDSRGRGPRSTPGCHGRQGEQRLRIDDQGQRHLLRRGDGPADPYPRGLPCRGRPRRRRTIRTAPPASPARRATRFPTTSRGAARPSARARRCRSGSRRSPARRRGPSRSRPARPRGPPGSRCRGVAGAGDDQELAAIGLARVVAMLHERKGLEQLGRDDPGR